MVCLPQTATDPYTMGPALLIFDKKKSLLCWHIFSLCELLLWLSQIGPNEDCSHPDRDWAVQPLFHPVGTARLQDWHPCSQTLPFAMYATCNLHLWSVPFLYHGLQYMPARLAPSQLHPKLMNDALECVAVVHCFFLLQFNDYRYVDFRACWTWVDLLPFHNYDLGNNMSSCQNLSVLGLGLTPFTARGWSSHPFGLSLGKALP